jgi:uncharacterized protein (DUF488 family)
VLVKGCRHGNGTRADGWCAAPKLNGVHMAPEDPLAIWTLGHSSLPLADFLGLLQKKSIERIADVRRYAGSRAHPHFSPEPLSLALAGADIDYCPFPELGGRRSPNPASTNTVWRHPAFRGYADYMETADFRNGLERLVQIAGERRTAILCAEALWWRCHRSLIADALKAQGMLVMHIMSNGKTVEHPYTSAARVTDGELRYGAGSP